MRLTLSTLTIGGIARLPGKSPKPILTPSRSWQESSAMPSVDGDLWAWPPPRHRGKALDNMNMNASYFRKTSGAGRLSDAPRGPPRVCAHAGSIWLFDDLHRRGTGSRQQLLIDGVPITDMNNRAVIIASLQAVQEI